VKKDKTGYKTTYRLQAGCKW